MSFGDPPPGDDVKFGIFDWIMAACVVFLFVAIAAGGLIRAKAANEPVPPCEAEVVTTREWDNWFGGPGSRTTVRLSDGRVEEVRGKLGERGDQVVIECPERAP